MRRGPRAWRGASGWRTRGVRVRVSCASRSAPRSTRRCTNAWSRPSRSTPRWRTSARWTRGRFAWRRGTSPCGSCTPSARPCPRPSVSRCRSPWARPRPCSSPSSRPSPASPRGARRSYGTDEELARFPPDELAGAGPMLAARLAANGIGDLARLRALGPSSMRALWRSRLGRDLWMELAGYDVPPVRTERRSVSHARVPVGPEKRDARGLPGAGRARRAPAPPHGPGGPCARRPGRRDGVPGQVLSPVSVRASPSQTRRPRLGQARSGRSEETRSGSACSRPVTRLHTASRRRWTAMAPLLLPASLDGVLDALRERYGLPCVRFGRTRWGAWPGQKISFSRVPGAFGQV